jgi:hypothetical protein
MEWKRTCFQSEKLTEWKEPRFHSFASLHGTQWTSFQSVILTD